MNDLKNRPHLLAAVTATIAALAMLTPLTVGAQQSPTPSGDSVPAYLLREVTVEARRAPTLRSDIPQQVDVVTRTDLDRTPAADVAEALKRTTPVEVIQFPALLSGVAVRGFRPQFSGLNPRTLILVDGRPAGVTNLATLELAAVERIEVLKGPASALYGSSAMGGAVNVVTRRSDGPLDGYAGASYGSFGSYRGELRAGGTLAARLDFDLTLAAAGRRKGFETGGARLIGDEAVTKYFTDGSTARLPDAPRDTLLRHAEFASRSGSLRLGYDLSTAWRLDARAERFRGDDIENPGDINVTAYPTRTLNDLERTAGDVSLSGRVGMHQLRLRGFTSREVSSYYDDADDPAYISSRSPNRWLGAQVQDVIALGRHRLTAGADLTDSEATSEVFGASGERLSPYSADASVRSLALFAEARADLLGDGRLVATAGGRADLVTFAVDEATLADGSRVAANDERHAVVNPSGGLVFQPGGGLRLHASAGRAFVTPSAFNVAGYAEAPAGESAVVVTRGNAELDPERSTSWDLGVGVRRPEQGIEADVTVFHTDIRDRVAAIPVAFTDVRLTPGGDTIRAITTYTNADDGEISGLEVALSYDLGARFGYPWSLRLFTTGTRLFTARETTGGNTSDIRNVADLTVIGGVEFDDLDRLAVRLSGRYVGERLDTDFSDFANPGDIRYPEFLVVDLSGSFTLTDRYRVTAQLSNLGDENYYEVRGYPMPGREIRVGFGVDW